MIWSGSVWYVIWYCVEKCAACQPVYSGLQTLRKAATSSKHPMTQVDLTQPGPSQFLIPKVQVDVLLCVGLGIYITVVQVIEKVLS